MVYDVRLRGTVDVVVVVVAVVSNCRADAMCSSDAACCCTVLEPYNHQ